MTAAPSQSRSARGVAVFLFLVAAVEGAILGVGWFRDAGRARAASPELRGREVAAGLGCFGCHGPDGERGIPDPKARSGEVPAWSARSIFAVEIGLQ